MVAALGKWEIRTDPSQPLESDAIRICRCDVAQSEVPSVAPELEQAAGDFIARQVLEKDAVFFEG